MAISFVSYADGNLPSRDPVIVLPILKQIKKAPPISALEKILGHYDEDIGSGVFILIWHMSDGSTVSASGPDLHRINHIHHDIPKQRQEIIFDIEKKAEQDGPPNDPQRGSFRGVPV